MVEIEMQKLNMLLVEAVRVMRQTPADRPKSHQKSDEANIRF